MYIYIYIFIYILENGETIREKSGKNQGICFTKLSGHPETCGITVTDLGICVTVRHFMDF